MPFLQSTWHITISSYSVCVKKSAGNEFFVCFFESREARTGYTLSRAALQTVIQDWFCTGCCVAANKAMALNALQMLRQTTNYVVLLC